MDPFVHELLAQTVAAAGFGQERAALVGHARIHLPDHVADEVHAGGRFQDHRVLAGSMARVSRERTAFCAATSEIAPASSLDTSL